MGRVYRRDAASLSEIQNLAGRLRIFQGGFRQKRYVTDWERIYNAKGNTYEAAVAMIRRDVQSAGSVMHYAEQKKRKRKGDTAMTLRREGGEL